ncbi:membrane-associated sensor protein [Paenibacillus taihuensis]|uniref:Membrane-associated sensor protein n=1 Tax=Paenibacillus taihuensis TaxID=1156355 RepID=A0A3D9SG00_9BACL|nr:MASE4 domain-containing protein [Paenibacillus taihuensis]REE94597.1 membrane-associated sensor protein [Paenibacillus taihuensis]
MEHQASKIAVQHLLSTPANRSQRRLVYVIGALICVLSLFAVPFARIQLVELPAYQPAIFSTVICFELITAYVLYSQFRINRLPSVLSLAAGYLFSGGMSAMYLLTFPGIFSKTGLFHAGTQTAPSLYLIWHIGLPTAIFGYVWFESKSKGKQLSPAKARRLAVMVTTVVLLSIAGCTVLTTKFHDSLPTLLKNGHLTSLFIYYISVPIIIYSVIALILFFRLSRGNTVTTAWLCIALLDRCLMYALSFAEAAVSALAGTWQSGTRSCARMRCYAA